MLVTRKIRNGKVKINGHWYSPDGKFMKYDGRLDGEHYCFGVYRNTFGFVSLWGSLKYKEGKEEFGKGKEVVNGVYAWQWWHEVGEATHD